jgi:beta-glucuronidase
VWINGTYLGDNEGGFLPFKLKIPNKILESNNTIAIEVENLRKFERLPSLFYDWYNWGGIYRDVELEIVPRERVEWIHIVTKEIIAQTATLLVKFKLTQSAQLKWKILRDSTVVKEGETTTQGTQAHFAINITNPGLWSPETPNLYEFQATLNGKGEIYSTKFGIRTITVKQRGIYLNEKLFRIKGVSLHEELMPYGRAIPENERCKDIETMKKIGFNTLRTAHYSHDEKLMELADELGILILEEIPVYWTCDFKNPAVLKLALKMLKTLIFRDFNHPSVILWSVGNEVPVQNRVCYQFMEQLMRYARKLDSSRIVTYVSSRMLSDRLRRKSNLPCLNLYFGWYLLSERNLNRVLDLIHETAPDQPLLITEFGAGAKYGFHSGSYHKFSEEKQASIISESILTYNSKDYIAGWIIWIYRDFRSPMRTNPYQQGFNRKGVVSDRNEAKLIARVLKNVLHKIPKKRKMGRFAKFYWLLLPLELFIFGLLFGFFEELVLRGQFERGYSDKPERNSELADQ